MDNYDAIIVGAGPTGCAAAFDLATAGMNVLLVDRHAFPRSKACAGALTMKSIKALRLCEGSGRVVRIEGSQRVTCRAWWG